MFKGRRTSPAYQEQKGEKDARDDKQVEKKGST
jgi:hypothetical protein